MINLKSASPYAERHNNWKAHDSIHHCTRGGLPLWWRIWKKTSWRITQLGEGLSLTPYLNLIFYVNKKNTSLLVLSLLGDASSAWWKSRKFHHLSWSWPEECPTMLLPTLKFIYFKYYYYFMLIKKLFIIHIFFIFFFWQIFTSQLLLLLLILLLACVRCL